jgi:hypothetical protein
MKHIQKLWCFGAALLVLTGCPNSSGSDDPKEPVLLQAITALTLTQTPQENIFTASWEPAQDLEGLSYELFHNETGTAPSAEASGLPVEQTQTQVSGLSGGRTYTVWVRPVLETQKGPWSQGEAITLQQDQTAMTLSIEVFGETRFAQIQGDDAVIPIPRNTPKPWRFTPRIALAQGAVLVSPAMGEEADFSDPEKPVHYLVKAENEREQHYRVTLSPGEESGLTLIREPEEDLLNLAELSLSRAKAEEQVLTVKDTQDCTWYVDGMLKGRNNGIRLKALDYKLGVHYLSVNGFKMYGADKVPWSAELVFTVTE